MYARQTWSGVLPPIPHLHAITNLFPGPLLNRSGPLVNILTPELRMTSRIKKLTPPTAVETLQKATREYPTLWGTNQYARMKCLTHIVFVNGNGYEWFKGRIVSIEELRGITTTKRERKREQDIALDAETTAEENDHVPFYSRWSAGYCLADTMPKNAAADWRALVIEAVDYYIGASVWHFPKYEGLTVTFNVNYMWECQRSLGQLRKKLTGIDTYTQKIDQRLELRRGVIRE